MYMLHHYKVDWGKISTVEDVIRILKLLHFRFEQDASAINEIEDLLIYIAKADDKHAFGR